MPADGSWDVIFGAEPGPLILCVGFPVTGRHEASFAELAAKIGTKYRFLQAKLPGPRVGGTAYVRHWIEEIQGRPVAAVLGHRVGSVYATALAEGISQWQPPPRVILFNPQFASVNLLGHELRRELEAISSLLSDDEIERTGKLAAQLVDSAVTRGRDQPAGRIGGFAVDRPSLDGAQERLLDRVLDVSEVGGSVSA